MSHVDIENPDPWCPPWAVVVAILASIAAFSGVALGLSLIFLPGPYRTFALFMGLPLVVPCGIAAPMFISFARSGGGPKLIVASILLAAAISAALYLFS